MANPLLTMEGANLYCGSAPPLGAGAAGVTATNPPVTGTNPSGSPSNHLILTEIKLPAMDEQYVDHRGAGTPVTIEIDTIYARFECTFILAGWTPQVQALIDSWIPQENTFYAYGAIRDRQTGDLSQAVAEMRGRLGRADPQNWRKGDIMHWNYAIRGLTRYTLTVADPSNPTSATPLYNWDFWTNTFEVGGVARTDPVNAALNIGF